MFTLKSSRTVRWLAFGPLILAAMIGASGCTTVATATPTAQTEQAPTPAAAPTQNVMPEKPSGPGGPGGGALASVDPTYKDLAYASVSPAQKLDLYIPEGSGPFPVVVMIHGGGFMMGDKGDGTGVTGADELLASGYAVASINYRLSDEATYPAQINDAKAAVRFLRANAAQYNLDTDAVAAFGASAGGNLAALLGTTCGVAELDGADLGNADQSSCVQTVVDWFGPIDFLTMDEQFAGTSCPQNHNAADSPESKLMGAEIQTVPDQVKTANPMTYIDANDPPFFIQHGSADCNVPPAQSENLAKALSPAIGAESVAFMLIDGAGHGGEQFGTEANLALIVSFLDKHLKPAS